MSVLSKFIMVGIKKHVLELGSLLVIPSHTPTNSLTHSITHSHTLFTHFSRTLGYFCQFWANFNMFGIKKHVLELGSSLVILSQTSTHSFRQSHPLFSHFSNIWGYFHHILANFNMLGIKKHVLEWGSSLVILSHTFTHSFTHFHTLSHTLQTLFTHFGLYLPFFSQCQHV